MKALAGVLLLVTGQIASAVLALTVMSQIDSRRVRFQAPGGVTIPVSQGQQYVIFREYQEEPVGSNSGDGDLQTDLSCDARYSSDGVSVQIDAQPLEYHYSWSGREAFSLYSFRSTRDGAIDLSCSTVGNQAIPLAVHGDVGKWKGTGARIFYGVTIPTQAVGLFLIWSWWRSRRVQDRRAQQFRDVDAGEWAMSRRSVALLIGTQISALVLAAIGGSAYARTRALVRDSAEADGVVVEVEHRKAGSGVLLVPKVEFVDKLGRSHVFDSPIQSNPPLLEVGERVRVLYDPDDPQGANIKDFWHLWALPAAMFASAAIHVLIGISVVIWERHKGKQCRGTKQCRSNAEGQSPISVR